MTIAATVGAAPLADRHLSYRLRRKTPVEWRRASPALTNSPNTLSTQERRARILLVEDDQSLRALWTRAITRLGYDAIVTKRSTPTRMGTRGERAVSPTLGRPGNTAWGVFTPLRETARQETERTFTVPALAARIHWMSNRRRASRCGKAGRTR